MGIQETGPVAVLPLAAAREGEPGRESESEPETYSADHGLASDAGPGRHQGRTARMGENDVDQALVLRVQKGDKRAFDLLVRKYQHKLVSVVGRYINDGRWRRMTRDEQMLSLLCSDAFLKRSGLDWNGMGFRLP